MKLERRDYARLNLSGRELLLLAVVILANSFIGAAAFACLGIPQ